MTDSVYPAAVDTPIDPTPTEPMALPSHAGVHTLANDAIVAVQETLGVTGAFNFAKLTDPSFESAIRQNVFNPSVPPSAAVPFGNQRALNMGTPLAITDGATANGSLIGSTFYEPPGGNAWFTTSATGAAIDTTNLTITCTAISTAVVVELSLAYGFLGGSGLVGYSLYTHNTLTQVGYWTALTNVASLALVRGVGLIRVAGLTVGTTYQWDWGWATTGGSVAAAAECGQNATFASNLAGPATMRAFAA